MTFTLKTYRIEYSGVSFVDGYTAPTEYNINNVSEIVLPPADKVVLSDPNKEFEYWKDAEGNRVDTLPFSFSFVVVLVHIR